MIYLNPFHKDATERKIRKIAESKKISDDIARRCQLYEAEPGDGKKHVKHIGDGFTIMS